MATRKKATKKAKKATRKSSWSAVTRGIRKYPSLVSVPGGERADRQARHEEAGDAVNQRFLALVAPRDVTHRDREHDHQQDAIQPMKGVMETPSVQEHEHAYRALQDEQGFSQDQRGTEATAGRLLPKVRHQAPDADDRGDQQPGPEQAIVQGEEHAHDTAIIVGTWSATASG